MPERATSTATAREVSSGRSSRRRGFGSASRDEGPNGQESESIMTLEDESPAMPASAGLPTTRWGEAPSSSSKPGRVDGSHEDERSGSGLMERVVSRANLMAAVKKVRANKGSAGVDGMTTEELRAHLMTAWPRLREELLAGRYHPQPVKRVAIPKSGGGMRELGIPTVVDRFIQQALLQVLQPIFDPTFSDSSFGFRPGRSAHQAVLKAQQYVQEGRRIVVDVDLEKFFDRVNHDVLMGRLEKRLDDKRMLVLIRRFLEAGVMMHGVVMARHEGTPQGGPLSPLLANFLLDEVDTAPFRLVDASPGLVLSTMASLRPRSSQRGWPYGAPRPRRNSLRPA